MIIYTQKKPHQRNVALTQCVSLVRHWYFKFSRPKYSDVPHSAIYAIFRYVCLYISISVISSLRIARAKFFNFCGQPCARLEADQSIYHGKDEHVLRSAISWVVELLCFGAPQAHMMELQRVWVDKSTSSPRWKDFNDKISKEWISITIYVRDLSYSLCPFSENRPVYKSTVMLTVDLTFLTLPSVNIQTSHSAAIITAYLSTFYVVGSLAVSILLAGQNRKYGNVSANSAVWDASNLTYCSE